MLKGEKRKLAKRRGNKTRFGKAVFRSKWLTATSKNKSMSYQVS